MNIVFDLGGVVFSWQPEASIESVFEDTETQKLVKAEIFDHPDWVELDRGTLDVERAIDRGAIRTSLPRSDIKRPMRKVPHSLTPIHETINLLRSIKETDNKFFVLSNMHFASIAYVEREYGIWDMFDGIVISCRIRKVKPETEIYEHLLNEYQLVADETIFIDDTKSNLVAASVLGIKTIKFSSASQCRQDLSEFRCI